jgi:hypothetical protein
MIISCILIRKGFIAMGIRATIPTVIPSGPEGELLSKLNLQVNDSIVNNDEAEEGVNSNESESINDDIGGLYKANISILNLCFNLNRYLCCIFKVSLYHYE